MDLLLLGTGNKINSNAGTNLNILDDIKHAYNKANVVEKIIYFNVLFFLITVLFKRFIIEWLALPADFDNFL